MTLLWNPKFKHIQKLLAVQQISKNSDVSMHNWQKGLAKDDNTTTPECKVAVLRVLKSIKESGANGTDLVISMQSSGLQFYDLIKNRLRNFLSLVLEDLFF